MGNLIARVHQKVMSYQPALGTVNLVQRTPILLLAGISGAGKDAIKAELLKTGKYHRIISHTTRAPRANHGQHEQHGVDYHFIDLEQAESMLNRQAFVEAKLYGGNVYGTSVAEIRLANRMKKIAVADVEVQGAVEYMGIDPSIPVAFILPPDYDTWQARLAKRHGDMMLTDELASRMRAALREIEHALQAGYLTFVLNRQLTEAAAFIDHLMQHRGTQGHDEARHVAEELRRALRAAYPS